MAEDDNELVSRCLKKEVAAEYELFRRFAPKMYGICLRYGGSEPEADEILQSGFIRLFSRLHQYRREGSLESWIKRIFVSTAINYYKNTLKFNKLVEITSEDEYSVVEEGEGSAWSEKELLEVIRKLPVGYRTIFNMFVIEDYRHEEIANLLGITIGTSKSQLNRAKALIRKMLSDRGHQNTIA